MEVTKITAENAMQHCVKPAPQTDEELQREYDYHMARKLTEKMLEKGLITADEYDRISAENLRYFSPFLAEIS